MPAAVTAKPAVVLVSRCPSPIGDLHLATHQGVLLYVGFDEPAAGDLLASFITRHLRAAELRNGDAANEQLHQQFDRYFSGVQRRFRLKTQLHGTDFQLQVWTALRAIPYGATVSYKHMAEAIGNPDATRAVGHAIGRNPIPIVVPCHRVIGASGELTGFGGGIERKQFLLELEGALLV
jgi:O-6-methylguanine DNA methyltransferase